MEKYAEQVVLILVSARVEVHLYEVSPNERE